MNNMKKNKITKIFLGILGVAIVAMGVVFGIQIYNSYKSDKLSSSDISISATASPNEENQLLLAVDVSKEGIYVAEYSFDGGKTWQTSNRYIATENKTLNIKLKDANGNIIGETSYEVNVIDHEGPIITINLPAEVKLNSTIDLLSYVEAKDSSGIKGSVTATPSTLDTSTVGKKQIVFKAVDNLGNETSITTEINVVDKEVTTDETSNNNSNNNSNSQTSGTKTYYRYRTKTVKTYECEYYNCDYIDYNDTVSMTVSFSSKSYCCTGDNCEKENPTINTPCPTGKVCIQVMTKRYKAEGDTCYDSTFIKVEEKIYSKTVCGSGEISVNGYCHNIESTGTYPSGCTTSSCVVFPSTSPCSGNVENPLITLPCPLPITNSCATVMVNRYQVEGNVCYDRNYITVIQPEGDKTVCDGDEINVGGYCHKIDSKGSYACPSGYVQTNSTTCAKQKQKTCSNTCNSAIWSDWSSWSTTKVIPTGTVEVQTKQM